MNGNIAEKTTLTLDAATISELLRMQVIDLNQVFNNLPNFKLIDNPEIYLESDLTLERFKKICSNAEFKINRALDYFGVVSLINDDFNVLDYAEKLIRITDSLTSDLKQDLNELLNRNDIPAKFENNKPENFIILDPREKSERLKAICTEATGQLKNLLHYFTIAGQVTENAVILNAALNLIQLLSLAACNIGAQLEALILDNTEGE